MSARPRKKKYQGLPEYLLFRKDRNTYEFTLMTGERKNLGANRQYAIEVALEYNLRMRHNKKLTLEDLIIESGGYHGEGYPLSQHVDHLLRRAIDDEQPSKDTVAVWQNDSIRIKEFFHNIPSCEITLEHVNQYIKKYHINASANVQNRKVSFLKKLFSYAMDESLMFDNPAERKKMKKPERKQRKRLSFDSFLEIHRHAPAWMKIAMELALQTTQARLEITRIRYSIKEPKDGVCGCVWLKEPVNGIYGTLYIHRQKTQHKEASHVAIPIGEAIKQIIDSSRDNIISPFIVHRLPDKNSNPLSKEVSHRTQVAPDYLSRTFSIIRDKLELYKDLSLRERPTFHEIRALSARTLQDQGYNPQARMAHSDEKSTRIYTENHRDWVHVPHVEIKINKINKKIKNIKSAINK